MLAALDRTAVFNLLPSEMVQLLATSIFRSRILCVRSRL
jgi:hypothetical protein